MPPPSFMFAVSIFPKYFGRLFIGNAAIASVLSSTTKVSTAPKSITTPLADSAGFAKDKLIIRGNTSMLRFNKVFIKALSLIKMFLNRQFIIGFVIYLFSFKANDNHNYYHRD